MPKFSIIVPVYKVEEFLPACIDSILAQTYADFELILVDDGSPDRSGEICDDYAIKDKRIRVIHNINSGVSSARNSGLRKSEGEYVVFVDSDDLVHPSMLQLFLDGFSAQADLDIVISNPYIRFTNAAKMTKPDMPVRFNCSTGIRAARSLFLETSRWEVWGTAYRRTLLIGFAFPESLRYAEDLAAVPSLFLKAANVADFDFPIYYYRVRENSAMTSTKKVGISDDLNKAAVMMLQAVETSSASREEKYDLISGVLLEPASRVEYASNMGIKKESTTFIKNARRLIRSKTTAVLKSSLPLKKKLYLLAVGVGIKARF